MGKKNEADPENIKELIKEAIELKKESERLKGEAKRLFFL